jgi:predicted metal-dependent HD superfamily phosphohydrolase
MSGRSSGQAGIGSAELVQRCWNDLTLRRGCAAPAAVAAFDEMVRAYREPHRHYHTLDHVAALLALLDRHTEAGRDRDVLTLAIMFHDVVYDPMRQDNEEASASLASNRLRHLGFSEETVAKVARCILATRHRQDAAASGDADIALLLDLDLAILAAPPGEYRAYAQAVRREYAAIPDALYRPGRRRVLEGFLARERIYQTERLRALWEVPSRTNLAAEMAELG